MNWLVVRKAVIGVTLIGYDDSVHRLAADYSWGTDFCVLHDLTLSVFY